MPRVWRLLAEYDAEGTTFAECAGTPASPYTPDFDGRLIALRTIQSQAAATTLAEHTEFRLTCSNFRPNTITVGVQGSGLMTAPAFNAGHMDWPVDQPIKSGVPITVEARNITAATPVSQEAFIYGCFDVAG